MLGGSLTLHVLAALTALAAPRLLGDLVEAVDEGTTTAYVDQVVMWLAGFLVVQTVLTRYARFLSQALGEQVLARLREDFVSNALALPVGTVESAGSGDLLTRTSRDVDQLGWSVRLGAAGVDDRGRHGRGHLHRGDQRRVVGDPPVPPRAASARDRPEVVPRPGQGRLPPRERVVLHPQRDPHRDGRGSPHGRGAGPRSRARRRDRRRHHRVVRRRALHAVPADGVLPEHGAVLPDPHGGDAAARGLALRRAARSPSARSPRRRSTCRC